MITYFPDYITFSATGAFYADKKVYEDRKNQSDKAMVLTVYFKPANAVGQADKAPEKLQDFSFTPVG